MGPLGFPELIIIFVVALIVFGPRKLPELGRSLGKSLSEFKRASNELRSTLDEEIRLEDRRAATASSTAAPASPSASAGAPSSSPSDGAAESSESAAADDAKAADSGPAETVARGEHSA